MLSAQPLPASLVGREPFEYMTESNAVAGSSSGHPTPATGSHSRIHFSDDQGSSGPDISLRPPRPEGGTLPSRKSIQASKGGTTSSKHGNGGRKRVRSLGAKSLLSDTSPFGTFTAMRSVDISRVQRLEKDPFDIGLDSAMDVFGPGALSDEYDLCESSHAQSLFHLVYDILCS
jgi:hypothetical protein